MDYELVLPGWVYLDAVFSGFTGALAQLRVLGFWFSSYFVVWSSCVGSLFVLKFVMVVYWLFKFVDFGLVL